MAEPPKKMPRLQYNQQSPQTITTNSTCRITTLPKRLLFIILLRLDAKTLVRCLSVCKTINDSILHPAFGKFYWKRSSESTQEIMLRPDGQGSLSRTLYLLDLDELQPYAEFLLPLNDEIASSGFDILSSCNGLVCLCKWFDKNPVLVCNPITKDYISIPRNSASGRTISRCNPIECGCSLCLSYDKTESESGQEIVASGFGYSPKNDQYKVMRIFDPRNYSHCSKGLNLEAHKRSAEIYILGSSSWRSTELPPQFPHSLLLPTYLKETINWVCAYNDKFGFIMTFNFDYEEFRMVHPSPPCFGTHTNDTNHIRMQELGGCLCVSDSSDYFRFLDIWLMKESSGKGLWIKAYSIIMGCEELNIQPIKSVKEGKLVWMVKDSRTLVSYSHLLKKLSYHKIREIQSHFAAFTYIPNFLSLKDIVKKDCQDKRIIVKY